MAAQKVAGNSRLALCGLSSEVRHLFEVCGFLDMFEIYADCEQAMAELQPA